MLWGRPLITALGLIAVIGLGAACSSADDIAAAELGVAHVHELFTERDFSKIYVDGDPALQGLSEAEFVRSMETTRSDYGEIRSSQRVAAAWRTGDVIFDGARFTGTFVILAYRTEFSTGPASETFTWRVLNDKIALMGWSIEPE